MVSNLLKLSPAQLTIISILGGNETIYPYRSKSKILLYYSARLINIVYCLGRNCCKLFCSSLTIATERIGQTNNRQCDRV